jgi:hypothetical protein
MEGRFQPETKSAAFLCALLSQFAACLAIPAAAQAQQPKPQTVSDFECYVQSAESRMAERKAFLLADADLALNQRLVREDRVVTVAPTGSNPRKIADGHVYDWIGTVFIPGATVERTIRMLQDYDHRAQYFPETIATSKLLCRTGEDRFRYSMRMKEPAVIDVDSEVVWERVGPRRWRCRSYSTNVQEIGKQHGYLMRLYSYWRIAEADKGVFVEGETITLSGEFGSLTRAFGSMMLGINPEKSLKHTLESMRETMMKPGMQFAASPAGAASCGAPFHPSGCLAVTERK